MTEEGPLTATGTLTVTDIDNGQAHTVAVNSTNTTYGSFSVDADGHWSYALNNGNATVQALTASQSLTDSFTVDSADGTAHQLVSLTIQGTNDTLVAPEVARRFVERLRAVSTAPVAYVELPWTQHAFEVLATPKARATSLGAVRFLEAVRVGVSG
mgnify:CR=1 FL=1